jgi:hypothetical protein
VGRFKFQMTAGGLFADNWAEIGNLNIGATLALGFAHVGGTSDEWFLSDFPVVWMMNPTLTQISDAHFLHEGSCLYRGPPGRPDPNREPARVLRVDPGTSVPRRMGKAERPGISTAATSAGTTRPFSSGEPPPRDESELSR